MLLTTKKIKIKYGDTIHLTPYSDLHLDNPRCDLNYMLNHMKQRAALPNSYFINIGDLGDWIYADDPRFVYDNVRVKSNNRQDVITEEIDFISEKLVPFPWIMIGSGNHEYTILKKHYISPGKEIAQRVGTAYGGYAGYLVLELIANCEKYPRDKVIILYHHGAFTGRLDAGYGKARDYARHFSNWNIFLYGHNHTLAIRPEVHIGIKNNRLINKTRFYINTGTFLSGLNLPPAGDAAENATDITNYAEKAAYPPSVIGCPLIKITLHRHRTDIKAEIIFDE